MRYLAYYLNFLAHQARSEGDSEKVESKGHNSQVLASRVSSLYRSWKIISEALHFYIMLLPRFFLTQVYTNHRIFIPFLNKKMRDCFALGLTLAASVKYRDVKAQDFATVSKFYYQPLLRYPPWRPIHVPRLDFCPSIPGSFQPLIQVSALQVRSPSSPSSTLFSSHL